MDKLARQVDIHHAVMQGSYFAGFSAIWGFGPVLLLYHGLSNSTLGVITSLALVLPLLIQPALASLSDADPRWTSRRLALVLSLITLAAAVAMMLLPEHKTVLLVSYAVIGVTLVCTAPFFNSMVMEYHLRGVNINYGIGRGTGSTTYAIVALVMGFVLERRSPTVILPVLLAALAVQIAAVWSFRYPLPPAPAAQEGEPPQVLGVWGLLRKYPAFPVMLVGCALLQGGHNACNTYMIHIASKVGAGEGLMGVILAVSAFAELPAMALFPRMHRRFSLRTLFLVCAAAFVGKNVLFLLAQSPVLLYLAAALQFFEFGIFLPATVYYAAETLDTANQAKGQGLIHVFSNGVGPAVIQSLVDSGLVKTAADLYRLRAKDIAKLDRMGEKSAANAVAAIEKSKENDLWRLISALGIRQVGDKAAKVLAAHFGSFDALAAASEEELTAIDDVGPITARYIRQWLESPQSQDLLSRLREAGVNMTSHQEKVDDRFAGQTFVLTGTLEKFTRDEAAAMIEQRGGKASGSVSKKTTYVVAGENAGSKLRKAQELNIPVLTEDEFLSMLQ